MWFTDVYALAALAGFAGLLAATKRWTWNKRWLLLSFNVAFLAVFSRFHGPLVAFALAYTAANYAGYVWLCRARSFRRAGFWGLIAANVAAVSAVRFVDMGVLPEPPFYNAIVTLGLIYYVLKAIDAVYFAYFVGQEGRARAVDYFNFILFVPTFTSGPILKFRDFLADAARPYDVGAADLETAVKRIVLGLFKKTVVVYWMQRVFDAVAAGSGDMHAAESLFLMAWFYVMIYFDFSGYSDIAIGFGRLFGYNVPENFKRPFLSPTLTQYWRNWHATMADWFRDHVYLLVARRNVSRRTAAGLSVVIMLLIGLWHGYTWTYVVWGLWHGAVLAVENLLGRTTVNRKKVGAIHFYARCLLTQLIVVLAVAVYIPDAELVRRVYAGLLFGW
ncbi:MAG: acyltransferase [Candidatus Reconcilbacillus cellulovorans]|uniref:Acyltransferase n=1 Tax=Candidatus Reconcilbacillus cellulovorans TaxID=1906605 RepID=A0A2A6E1D2_9BACL|nr:MAG: acyltransferase [Candidatus Reconcilbacillus cellulovorans]